MCARFVWMFAFLLIFKIFKYFGIFCRILVSNVDIANVDIANMDIANVDIASVDIANVDIANMDISNVDISNVDISKARPGPNRAHPGLSRASRAPWRGVIATQVLPG